MINQLIKTKQKFQLYKVTEKFSGGKMLRIFKSRSIDSDSDRILPNNDAEIETELLNSTCLKIQTVKGEILELSGSEERSRGRLWRWQIR